MATCSVANYQPSLNKSIYDAMAYPKRPSAIQILSEGASSGAREGEQLQAGLTLALERLHKSNGNSLPVHMLPPGTSLHDMDVFGFDLTTLITVPECKQKWWRNLFALASFLSWLASAHVFSHAVENAVM